MNGLHNQVTPSAHEINRRVRAIERGQEYRGYPSPELPAIPDGNSSPTDRNDGHRVGCVFGAALVGTKVGIVGASYGGAGGAVFGAILGIVIGAILGYFMGGRIGWAGTGGDGDDGGDGSGGEGD